MPVSKIEQETVILFNEAEAAASVYTYNGALKRKLTGLCATRPTEARQTKDDGRGGLTFEVPLARSGNVLSCLDTYRAERAAAQGGFQQ